MLNTMHKCLCMCYFAVMYENMGVKGFFLLEDCVRVERDLCPWPLASFAMVVDLFTYNDLNGRPLATYNQVVISSVERPGSQGSYVCYCRANSKI